MLFWKGFHTWIFPCGRGGGGGDVDTCNGHMRTSVGEILLSPS